MRPPPTIFPRGLCFSALTKGGFKCQELGKPLVRKMDDVLEIL